MTQKTLHILHCPFRLSERCNGSAYDLERQFRQFELTRQFMQDTLPVVAGVHKPALRVRKDERVGRSVWTLLLPATSLPPVPSAGAPNPGSACSCPMAESRLCRR